jgi:iron complex outermembrane recepter protein
MKIKASLTLIAASLIAMGHSAVQAQEVMVLEEVLVVATKRTSSLQDVAVSVSALSADALRDQQINTVQDLTRLVPSLNKQSGDSFNIRGIGTQARGIANEPSVSTMLDGVVLGSSRQAFMQLMDVERVEVLRGPQGTLFGKNSTAGVIHIMTKNPTEEHYAEISGTVISDDEYRAGVLFSGPVTDDLGYSFTAFGTDVDGYTENIHTGNDLSGTKDWTTRGKLRWTGETVEVKWASDYSEGESECCVKIVRSLEPVEGREDFYDEAIEALLPLEPDEEGTKVNHDQEPYAETESWGHSLEVNWDIGEYTLTSISAFRNFERDAESLTDLDATTIDRLGLRQPQTTDNEQFTQELRITSPAHGSFSYVAGLFYYDQESKRELTRRLVIESPTLNPDSEPGVGVFNAQIDTKNWAAFGEGTLDVSDTVRLIAGLRYTEDELDYEMSRTKEGFPVGIPAPIDPPESGGTDEDNLSGKLALQWDFSDAGMGYLSYTQGYKGPAFDIVFGVKPDEIEPIDPEESDSWELGVKTELFDNRLRLNASLFYSVYDDFQATAYLDPDGLSNCPIDEPGCDPDNEPGSFKLINAGEVQTQGLELDFTALLTENLRLSGGVAFIDATIEEYDLGKCSNGQILRGECPSVEGVQDLAGGDLPYSPDWKLTLTSVYTWQRDSLFDVEFIGTVQAQDEVLYDISQDENMIADGYETLDLSVRFIDHNDRWSSTLFVKNVTDEFYVTNIGETEANAVPNGYTHRMVKQSERQYGIDFRYKWQ